VVRRVVRNARVNGQPTNDQDPLRERDLLEIGGDLNSSIDFELAVGIDCLAGENSTLRLRPQGDLEINWRDTRGQSSCSVESDRVRTLTITTPERRIEMQRGMFVIEDDNLRMTRGQMTVRSASGQSLRMFPNDQLRLAAPPTPAQRSIWVQPTEFQLEALQRLPRPPLSVPTPDEISRSPFLRDIVAGTAPVSVYTSDEQADQPATRFTAAYMDLVQRSWAPARSLATATATLTATPTPTPTTPAAGGVSPGLLNARVELKGREVLGATLNSQATALRAERSAVIAETVPATAAATPAPTLMTSDILALKSGERLRIVFPSDPAADAALSRFLRSAIDSGAYFDLYYGLYKERPPYEELEKLLE
jgi:hypothetical protein